jgi:hypothetical protein
MSQLDLSQYTQQQYELVKCYIIFASLGCAFLFTVLCVAATSLWRELKGKNSLDSSNPTCQLSKLCAEPIPECIVTQESHDAKKLKLREIHYGQEHDAAEWQKKRRLQKTSEL